MLPPGNARWIALSAGVGVLSVVIAVVVGAFGLFGFSSANADGGRAVEARVVAGAPCDRAGATETVRFTVDGREHRASFDGCGHQPEEPVEVMVPAGQEGEVTVHAAAAATGDSGNGRRLGLVLLVVSGMAGAVYGLLVRRGPRGTPLPLLGPFVVPDLRRLTRRG